MLQVGPADSFLTVKARLARALLELSEHLSEDAGAGRVLIPHKINQSDLAAMAGVAREYVSKVLSNWKRRDLVTHSSGLYCLADLTNDTRGLEPKANAALLIATACATIAATGCAQQGRTSLIHPRALDSSW